MIKSDKKSFDKIEINGNTIFENGKLNGGLLSFILYDTYGFPFDLTQQILKEKNIEINEQDFNKYLEEQKNRSKFDREKNNFINAKNNEILKELSLKISPTEKIFYNNNAIFCDAKILAIIINNEIVDEVNEQDECIIILDKTIFYATSGGEVGDKGMISKSKVLDTKKLYGDVIGHFVFAREKLKVGDNVSCFSFRKNVCKNHTATHLLQSALRIVLGENIQQKGSQVDENGLRFDFSSDKSMTDEQIKQVEDIVNGWVRNCLPVKIVEMSKHDAEKIDGVIKLFDEKYGEKVRVVRVFDLSGKLISAEFCGGIHCNNTGEIEKFLIESEKSIGSGVRRITAATGFDKCLMLTNFRDEKKAFETLKEEVAKYKSNQAVQVRYESLYEMRESAKNVNGVLFMRGKNVDQEIVKIACRYISLKNNKPVFVVVVNNVNKKEEYFCYTTCQKDNNFDCKSLIQKLINLTNGKGGGTANFAQVVHYDKDVDYNKLLSE